MIEAIILVILGLVLLTFAADKFVDGAVGLSINLKIPTLIIGLVVIGFATSAPELIVSVTAAFSGHPSLSLGNAVGSNIANIGLVLGITSIIVPLHLSRNTFKVEFRLMILALIIFTLLVSDLKITRIDGLILIFSLFIILFAMIKLNGKYATTPKETEGESKINLRKSIFLSSVGFLTMLLASEILVRGSIDIAKFFGASDLFIGLTIVAVGTSLPELAASVAGALKKEVDLAIGNIIGSNTFNALAVTAMPALVSQFLIESEALSRDIVSMWLLTFFLIIILLVGKNKLSIGRYGGCFLAACFCFYQFLLFQAQMIT